MLGLIVAEHLFATHLDLSEGWLSRARSSLVRATTLAAVAENFGLGEVLRLGKGEAQSGGRTKPSLLADALEALIGAVFLDGGLEPTRRLVLMLLASRIEALPGSDDVWADPAEHDFKSRLQEFAARRLSAVPVYHCEESGPEHAKLFEAVVQIDGVERGAGSGRNKKQAEQAAAHEAFLALVADAGLPTSPDPDQPVLDEVAVSAAASTES